MLKRAWWLLLLSFLVPGSAQLLAGNRKLARIALVATGLLWSVILLLALVALPFEGQWLAAIATQGWFLTGATFALVAYAVLYALIALDTLRLMQVGRMIPRDKWIATVVLLALAGTISTGFGAAANVTNSVGTMVSQIFAQKGFYAPSEGRYNILLLGADSGKDRFGIRPDSISVISVDAATGQAVNIGIPRNLQKVRFAADSPLRKVFPHGWSCGDSCLINAIYKEVSDNYADLYPDAEAKGSTPGVEATKDAVEWVTGLHIDSYVMIDMAAFAGLVDALGGVDINVKERLPIGGQRSDMSDVKGWIEVGQQHMDGYTALWYARSRHSTTDYDRMRRQREVEDALLDQAGPVNIAQHMGALANAAGKMVKTDIPSDMFGTYFNLARKAKELGLKKLELVPPTVNVVYPDFDGIRTMIQAAFEAQG